MLDFLKVAFRGLVVVFLWINLIVCIVSGLLFGWKLGGGGWAFLGLIAGIFIGILTNILCGGFIATILCIEDKLDGLGNKYVATQRLLETISGTLVRIERGMITEVHNANKEQKMSATDEKVLPPEMIQIREKLLSITNTEIPNEHIKSEPEQNAIYDAVITRIVALGAFAEYLPGKSGMIASTEIANEMVAKVDDVLKVGDKVRVKIIGFERSGSAKLSIKALL